MRTLFLPASWVASALAVTSLMACGNGASPGKTSATGTGGAAGQPSGTSTSTSTSAGGGGAVSAAAFYDACMTKLLASEGKTYVPNTGSWIRQIYAGDTGASAHLGCPTAEEAPWHGLGDGRMGYQPFQKNGLCIAWDFTKQVTGSACGPWPGAPGDFAEMPCDQIGAGVQATDMAICGIDASQGSGGGSPGPSPGCAVTGMPVGDLGDQHLTVNGHDRTYILTVPASYQPSAARSLIFEFHGCSTLSSQVKSFYQVREASGDQAIFVYPQGTYNAGGSCSAVWDVDHGDPGNEDLALVDAIIASVGKSYCLDPKRVFATGHSYGAFFTDSLGCYRGDTVRAIAPVEGNNLFAGACQGAPSTMIVHANNDTVVPCAPDEVSADAWRKADGCTTASSPTGHCQEYQGCAAGKRSLWCPFDNAVPAGQNPVCSQCTSASTCGPLCGETGGAGCHDFPSWVAAEVWTFFSSFP